MNIIRIIRRWQDWRARRADRAIKRELFRKVPEMPKLMEKRETLVKGHRRGSREYEKRLRLMMTDLLRG